MFKIKKASLLVLILKIDKFKSKKYHVTKKKDLL